MIDIVNLRLMNETQIVYLINLGKSTKRNEIIRQILEEDSCFFKLDKDIACELLEDVGIKKDKVLEVYSDMTSRESYWELIRRGKINKEDDELKIKYEENKIEDIFNKKNQQF